MKTVKFAQVADGLLASQMRARIADAPPILAITTGTRAADIAIETLTPYATEVTRGR